MEWTEEVIERLRALPSARRMIDFDRIDASLRDWPADAEAAESQLIARAALDGLSEAEARACSRPTAASTWTAWPASPPAAWATPALVEPRRNDPPPAFNVGSAVLPGLLAHDACDTLAALYPRDNHNLYRSRVVMARSVAVSAFTSTATASPTL